MYVCKIGLFYLYFSVGLLSCVSGGNGKRSACPNDKWGLNCSTPCSFRCFENVCDSLNGLCSKGCIGFTNPPSCDEECSNNTFGRNCSQMCPDLCNSFRVERPMHVCHHVTGKCFPSSYNAYMGSESELHYSPVVLTIGTIMAFAVLIACIVNYLHNWNAYKKNSTVESNASSFIECSKMTSDFAPCEQNESKLNFFSGSSTSFNFKLSPSLAEAESEV